ncbi:MAG: HD domain-containing protein [Opitutales bacterium]|nr:HD domain-containing protein [Opitutales bacterium]
MDSFPATNLPESLEKASHAIAAAVRKAGGRAMMVGGAVRDQLFGLPVKDADIEVSGLSAERLRGILKERFQVIEVGASFGVFKLRGLEMDVSIPRREAKHGTGHKGFIVEGDPHMSLEEAALRRDFTINALYRDILSGELVDPLGGLRDFETRTLRHCGPRFVEDPLRVLRAMQFIARFRLKPAPETLEICRSMTSEELPEERIFEEWKKLLLKGQDLHAGLVFLKDCGWLRYFPELMALVGCEQWAEWHPEGDVWTHTLHCLDAYAAMRTGDEEEDLTVGLAVLCHDLGKPATTFTDDAGRIRAPGHDQAGVAPTLSLLARMTRQKQLIEDVVSLVKEHMQAAALYKEQAGRNAIRRLATRVRIDRLVRVTRADMRGTPPRVHDEAPCDWLLEQAKALQLEREAPKPIILGRHLIALGMQPGREFKAMLDKLFEEQLEGNFSDEASGIEVARRMLENRG